MTFEYKIEYKFNIFKTFIYFNSISLFMAKNI